MSRLTITVTGSVRLAEVVNQRTHSFVSPISSDDSVTLTIRLNGSDEKLNEVLSRLLDAVDEVVYGENPYR